MRKAPEGRVLYNPLRSWGTTGRKESVQAAEHALQRLGDSQGRQLYADAFSDPVRLLGTHPVHQLIVNDLERLHALVQPPCTF